MDLLGVLRIKDSNGNWVSVPGLKGDTGEPFKILGIYATAAALEADVTDPEYGDVYLVGTVGAYDIYLYLADGWHNTGRYMPKGDQGDPAPQSAITSAVETWLAANVDPETGYVLDRTLSQALAAAPADLVGELKSVFSNITRTVYGKNRWNINSYVFGYLAADGSITPNDTWRTTDFCYVEGFANIIASIKNSGGVRASLTLFYLCTYDSDKNFIERKWTTGSSTAELDSNVAYVRFSYNDFAVTEYQLEEGTTRTAYEPFIETTVIKTDLTLANPVLPANAKAVGDALANQSVDGVISYTPVTLSLTSGKLINGTTGVITDSENTNHRISDPVSVADCRKIAVNTQHNWGQGMVVFFDADGNFVSGGMKANIGSTVTRINFQIFDVPINASTVIIGFNYTAPNPEPFLFKGVTQDVKTTELWSGKKWVCVGDSLTAYNTMTSVHYFDYIKAATGINIVNMGVSGSGYAKNNDNFMTRVLNVPTDADVVTIFGSGNDASSGLPLGTATDTGTDTLGGVINTTIDNLYSIMPVVQLGLVTPTPWQGNMPSDNGWMENYSNLIKEICNLRSIPCLDLFHCSNLNPNSEEVRALAYSNDGGGGVHPNELGHKIIASRFKAFLDSLVI